MTHEEITKAWNPKSSFCGKLVQRHDHIWHFSVGLDDNVAMAWGEKHLGGRLVLHQMNNQFIETKMVILFPPEKVLENLHLSLDAFDGKWHYNSLGWNCEHWARLATTGNPVSYQVEQCLFGLLNGFGMFGLSWRPEAVQALDTAAADKLIHLPSTAQMPHEAQGAILTGDEMASNSPVG